MRLLRKLARWLLSIRANLYWHNVENHVRYCNNRKCKWIRENNLLVNEDQDENMFCFNGNKIWSKHWDMMFHANSIPE